MRSYLLAGNTAHYDGVIAAMEARGLRVIPAFATGLDSRPAIEKYFLAAGQPVVESVVSLTGFSLVGGPAYNDARAAEEMLVRLDVPYLAVTPVEFQTLDQWEDSDRGLLPVESTMMVALPELDGATGSMVFGGRSGQCQRRAVPRHAIASASGPTRWPPASPSWSICAGRRARSARSGWCCSTSRPMPATPAPPPIWACSNRCTTR